MFLIISAQMVLGSTNCHPPIQTLLRELLSQAGSIYLVGLKAVSKGSEKILWVATSVTAVQSGGLVLCFRSVAFSIRRVQS